MAPKTPKPTPTPTPVVPKTSTSLDNKETKVLPSVVIGDDAQEKWEDFLNGNIIEQSGTNTGGLQSTPYVSKGGAAPSDNPQILALMPSKDGKKYTLNDLDAEVSQYVNNIPANQVVFYKQQLKDLYPSIKAYEFSLTGTQNKSIKDLGFIDAVKKSIQSASVDNFRKAKEIAKSLEDDPSRTVNTNTEFYTFDRYVKELIPSVKEPKGSGISVGLTTREDAYAEFERTVQSHIGNPKLVDKKDDLKELYFNRIRAIELSRPSGAGVRYSQLSEEDRLDLRLGLMVNGDKLVKSVGIKNATQGQLQNAGGFVGKNYTDLLSHARQVGIRVDNESLLKKVTESLKPGGVAENLGQGLEQQKRSLTMASQAHYKNFAPQIEGGLSVVDLASNFMKLKEQEHELMAGSVDVFDEHVQAALTNPQKIMDRKDYLMLLRSDPKYRFTNKANERSANLITLVDGIWGKN